MTEPRTPDVTTQATAGKTILLVEDDNQVRRVTRKRLEILGYTIVEAENADDAVHLLSLHPEIALVLADCIMPGEMSGYDLAQHVIRHFPDTAILLTSGYAEDVVEGRTLSASGLSFLRKPYWQEQLAASIREAIEIAGARAKARLAQDRREH